MRFSIHNHVLWSIVPSEHITCMDGKTSHMLKHHMYGNKRFNELHGMNIHTVANYYYLVLIATLIM